jgi:hypothetical protein
MGMFYVFFVLVWLGSWLFLVYLLCSHKSCCSWFGGDAASLVGFSCSHRNRVGVDAARRVKTNSGRQSRQFEECSLLGNVIGHSSLL